MVVIIANDGKVTVEVKEPKGMFGVVVEALASIPIEIGKAGVETVAKAAKEAAGDAVTGRVAITDVTRWTVLRIEEIE